MFLIKEPKGNLSPPVNRGSSEEILSASIKFTAAAAIQFRRAGEYKTPQNPGLEILSS
jgi:hypothetical protein